VSRAAHHFSAQDDEQLGCVVPLPHDHFAAREQAGGGAQRELASLLVGDDAEEVDPHQRLLALQGFLLGLDGARLVVVLLHVHDAMRIREADTSALEGVPDAIAHGASMMSRRANWLM
jgi:hypothetical protein